VLPASASLRDNVVGFYYSPADPSIFDTIQFYDQSYDPAGAGVSSELWDFGDGASAMGTSPRHRYPADGTYRLTLTVSTRDGRTASTSRDVLVRTHDVAVAGVAVPQTAKVGQTLPIAVGLTNSRYPERVRVVLLKRIAGGGWQHVGVLTQNVPAEAGHTTSFAFDYTFTPEDGQLGQVSFQAIAAIQGARDAAPDDNTFVSLPTSVTP
jgi:PKD repeat protein